MKEHLAQPLATLLVGFGVTLVINRQQIQISKANREQDLQISKENREQELRISQENNEEEILQKYLESIEKLLLDYKLNNDDENNQARNVARFKTLTVLRRLTFKPERDKAIILKFLYDTELIKIQNNNKQTSKLSLVSCDFQGANLTGANLNKANLNGANLIEAKLNKAILFQANFYKVNLTGANLIEANLTGANFFEADLQKANLQGVNLIEADLQVANLTRANLTRANLTRANLLEAYLYQTKSLDIEKLKSAENWEKAVYTEANWDKNKLQWIPKDKEANKAKIQEIRDSKEGYVKF